MAYTKKIAVDGVVLRLGADLLGSAMNGNNNSPSKNRVELGENVLAKILNDIQWLERFLSDEPNTSTGDYSKNFIDYFKGRELGNQKLQRMRVSSEYGTRQLLRKNLVKETEISLHKLNKVFCSQWLNDRQIVFGTKCNKLIVLDVTTGKMVQIPNLKSSDCSTPPENPCGIHALEINPSRTLLVTGAQNSNDIAVYKLPTLDPVCVGEGAHTDWIFDITWLDDEFFVSGSRDTTIALWRVKNDNAPSINCHRHFPHYYKMYPLAIKSCKNAEKVRALLFNGRYQELVTLSLNAYLHLWDAQTFKQKFSRKLPYCQENVCMAEQIDHSLYAVGSRSHITLLDTRTLQPAQKVASKYHGCGVRSLSFLGELLTIGTGVGVMLFYDVRASNYLLQSEVHHQPALLKATRGWVYPDESVREVFFSLEYNPAIYTHCYGSSGTQLFAAGGPLPASLNGNYAGLWQ